MPPKSNTTCWRCRHDRQGCVRDPYDPATCDRCKRFKYTCTLAEPTLEEREGRVLDFWKCSQCRDARQKCRQSQVDPGRCDRCVVKNLPCSPRTNKKQMPRNSKKGSGGGGSSGGSPGDDYTEGDSNSPDYDFPEEEEGGFQGGYNYEAGSSANQHYASYGHDYNQYTQYPGYGAEAYHQASYEQSDTYAYGHPQYNYNGY